MFDNWRLRNVFNVTLVMMLLLLAVVPAQGASTAPGGAAQLGVSAQVNPNAWRLPFIRVGQTTILDPLNNQLILFGGWNGQQFFNDVWAFDLASGIWTKLNPDNAWPGARGQHTAIYDPINRRMIIYGGHGLHYNFDDVWALDLTTPGSESWTQLQPAGTPIGPRRYHSAVYDADRQQMLVFGGSRGAGLRNDIWALDLTSGAEAWSALAVAGTVPTARGQHTAIYDDNNGLMVVFGGGSAGGLLDDTWFFDPETLQWTKLPGIATAPPARRGHTAIFIHNREKMVIFGGVGSGGFLGDTWFLDLKPGDVAWWQPSMSVGSGEPGSRAWHSAVYRPDLSLMYVFGGRGMDSLQGETQWLLNLGGMSWSVPETSLSGWWGGGTHARAQSVQSNGIPDVSLEIEDAPPGTRVHLMLNAEVWFVVKLKTTSAGYANDVDVTLDVVAPHFNVTDVGIRHRDADEVTSWSTPEDLGGGRYRLQNVDLTRLSGESKYQNQVVFKATPTEEARGSSITAVAEGAGWSSALDARATARIHRDPPAWIITNRTKLFEAYNNSDVRALLDKLYQVAASRSAVVFYLDREITDLETWDNTTVNYASETTANAEADQVADWLVSRMVDLTPYPTFSYPNYLVIIGDDNIIPRYRKHDYNLVCADGPCSEDDLPDCWGAEAVCDDLVIHNYFFTDNPYGDREYGTFYADWEEGSLEASVGRIVGASAVDMRDFLNNAARGPNPQQDTAIIASGDGVTTDCVDWWLPGADNDPQNVLKLFMGYDVDESFIDNAPSKAEIVAEMVTGFSVAALAHHGEVTAWSAPDDGDHLWSYEIADYDPLNLMPINRPFFYFNACRVGLTYSGGWDDPAVDEEGPQTYDDSLVYGIIHQGTSGVVASGGLAYMVPDNNVIGSGERLSNDFWARAKATPTRSDPLGYALREAKINFSIADDFDRKTVQEFTYFGLPWMRLPGHANGQASAAAVPQREAQTQPWSAPSRSALGATYVVTANVDAAIYAVSTTVDGFDLIEVDGLEQRMDHNQVILPQATLDIALPLSATVTGLVFTPTQEIVLSDMDIPTMLISVGSSGGTGTYTDTVSGSYPVTATFETRPMDTYQRVRVNVVPVTYDAGSDQATLYRNVDVAVAYDTPATLALTNFAADKSHYLPGEAISTTTHLVNVSDAAETVTATLILQDSQGQVVGFQASGAFEVAAGETYDLKLGWAGPLDGDTYLARIFIWQSGDIIAADALLTEVTDGEVIDIHVPDTLLPGSDGNFDITFENLGASTTIAMASLAIYDQDDVLVDFQPAQSVAVSGGSQATLTFTWAPLYPGAYTASFMLTAGGEEYGPLTQSFNTGYHVYLPLTLRVQ